MSSKDNFHFDLNKYTCGLLLLLAISSLFMYSCTSSKDSNVGDVNLDVLTGTEGLSLEFKSSGGTDIAEEESLSFVFKLTNKGAYDASDIVLINPIYDQSNIRNILLGDAEFGTKLSEPIIGKTLLSSVPNLEVIEGTIEANKLSSVGDVKRNENFMFGYCYGYATSLDDEICVDPDINGLSSESKLCTVEEKSYSGGQGSPIEITSVSVTYEKSGDKVAPVIEVSVSNSGAGKVITSNNYAMQCDSAGVSRTDDDYLMIEELLISGLSLSDFDCRWDTSKIIQRDNSGKLFCKIKDSISSDKLFDKSMGAFNARFHLKLSFYYRDSIPISLTVSSKK